MSSQSSQIILHQYDSSPFSEKVRVVLGIKKLEWHAVDQPVILPKPDLVCLTGGYRRIPVLQIGADIYCDSLRIVRELERRFPEPSILVGDDAGLTGALGFWTDRPLFQAAVGVIFGGIGDNVDEAFRKDREQLTGRPFDVDAMRKAAPMLAEQLRAHVAFLAEQLADERAFLFGETPGLADAHCYYNLWFVRSFYPSGAAVLEPFANVLAWERRVRALGHGVRHAMERDTAVEIASRSTSQAATEADPEDPQGLQPGDDVLVSAEDYGRDRVAGQIVAISAFEIAIRRQDERVGEVVVHFPRAGFHVQRG